MISIEEACALIDRHVAPRPATRMPLGHALGHVLAQDLKAKAASPRFDASNVDGYAVSLRSFDRWPVNSPVLLPVSHTVHAGRGKALRMSDRETVRVFTGGAVPVGADAVVMQEFVEERGGLARFSKPPQAEENIRRIGSEFLKGAKILSKGTLITPPVLSTIAALGYDSVLAVTKPRVALVITGDELCPPGAPLRHGEIWDSNATGLTAALNAMGFDSVKVYRARDTLRATTLALTKAARAADFVIVTGGVSVGGRDYLKSAAADLGVKQVFWQVSVKPGKPAYFGVLGKGQARKYLFGLPGNPVSAMVTFQLLARRAILIAMGVEEHAQSFTAVLSHELRKAKGRTEFVRGSYSSLPDGRLGVSALREQESYMTSGLAHANCLIEFPIGEAMLAAGSLVTVHPLRWALY